MWNIVAGQVDVADDVDLNVRVRERSDDSINQHWRDLFIRECTRDRMRSMTKVLQKLHSLHYVLLWATDHSSITELVDEALYGLANQR